MRTRECTFYMGLGIGYCCGEDCSYIIGTIVSTYYYIIIHTYSRYNVVRLNDKEIHLTNTARVIK